MKFDALSEDVAIECDLIRVALVGGSRLFRAGLRMLVETADNFKIIGDLDHPTAAVGHLDGLAPDLVLFDIDEAPDEALSVLTQVMLLSDKAAIIILTSRAVESVTRPLVEAGARGVLLKDMTADRLVDALRRVCAGDWPADSAAAGPGISSDGKSVLTAVADRQRARIESLTRREREVILLVASGLSNKAAARQLGISDNTVRHHLTSIFAKLETHDRLELVLYALRHGLTRPAAK